jgi:tetratricopeptide (TPR) repeat protein
MAAIQHAHAAIAHGSDDATALAVAAYIIAYDEHDTATALRLFDSALELSSSNVFALSFSAIILAYMGKVDLAIERAQLTLRLSPFDIYNFRAKHALAIVHFYCQRYTDALDAARSAVHANPKFSTGHAVLAATLLRIGRTAEAKAAAQDVLEHEPTFTVRGLLRVIGLEPAVFRPLADAWREIGLPE